MIPLNCQASQKPREQNECGDLPMEWVDSVLNLKMTNVVLKGDSGVNPPLRLSLVLHAEVIRKAGRVVPDNQIMKQIK